jgi:hypothetical protein
MVLSPEQIIATICPEASGSPSLPVYREMAVQFIIVNYVQGFFRGLYSMAVAYLTCHYFSIMGDNQGSGGSGDPYSGIAPVAGMSEGGESISYAVSAAAPGDENSFSGTKYGVMFLQLVKQMKKSIVPAGVNMAGIYGGLA